MRPSVNACPARGFDAPAAIRLQSGRGPPLSKGARALAEPQANVFKLGTDITALSRFRRMLSITRPQLETNSCISRPGVRKIAEMRIRVNFITIALYTVVLSAGTLLLSHLFESRSRALSQPKTLAAQPARPAPAIPVAPKTMVVYKTNRFDWSQLESTDYRQYIANLRAIGCPEATLRDIIMTDVMRLYALRRGQFEHNGREFKFWETDELRKPKASQLEEREKQLALINKELPGVLRELLGINYEREINKYFLDTSEDERRLAFLSEDKRAQLAALRDQFEGKRERVYDQAQNGVLSTADMALLKQIETEQATALDGVLSPEERDKYELCTSETADRLRSQLVGFHPTEEEFREIFKRQTALDAKYQYLDTQDEAVRTAQDADQQQMEQELKATLGDGRMAEYQQSKDADYRSLTTFAEQFDLPASTSQSLQEMRQIAEGERQKLLLDRQLPPERRQQALNAIQAETERTFQQTLGRAPTPLTPRARGPGFMGWERIRVPEGLNYFFSRFGAGATLALPLRHFTG